MATLVRYDLSFPSETHAVHYDHYAHQAAHRPAFHPHPTAPYKTFQPAGAASAQMPYVPLQHHFQSQPAFSVSSAPGLSITTPSSSMRFLPQQQPESMKYSTLQHTPTSSSSSHDSSSNMAVEDLDEAADILLQMNKSQPSCMGCGVSHTPAWRNGGYLPGGRKRLLCNACGLRYKRNRSGNSSS